MPQTTCDCDTKEYESALEVLFGGTLKEAREAKRALHRMYDACKQRKSCAKQPKDVIDRVATHMERVDDAKRLTLLIQTLNNYSLFFNASRSSADLIAKVIRTYIVNEHGHVRDAARHLAGMWRIRDPYNMQKPTPETIEMLTYVRDRINEHRPNEPSDKHLDELPPSVYKSLLLLWERLTGGLYMEQWIAEHPEFQIAVPPRTYEDEPWLEENPVDRGEVLQHLWDASSVTTAIEKTLKELEGIACERFTQELEHLGFTKKERTNKLIQAKTARAVDTQEMLCMHLVTACLRKNHSLEKARGVMRELQAVINHIVRQLPHLHSYFLLSAVSEREMAMKPKLNDVEGFLADTLAVHRAIDKFKETFLASRREERDAFEERIKERMGDAYQKDTDLIEKWDMEETVRMHESRSIAHHVWDWYAQTKSWYTSKPPEKNAALAYFAVFEINSTSYKTFTPYAVKDLSAFGGWKSEGSARSPGYTLLRDILPRIIDTDLLHLTSSDDEETLEMPLSDESSLFFGDEDITTLLDMVEKGFHRYFAVVSSEQKTITNIQKERLRAAIHSAEKDGECMFENIVHNDNYALIELGISIDVAPQSIIEDIILSANGLEPFLRFHFFITNTHKPTEQEIKGYLDDIS